MNDRSWLNVLLVGLLMGWVCKDAAALVTSPEKEDELPAAIEGYVEGQKKATSADSEERAAAQKQAQSIRDTTANQIKSLRQPVKPAAPSPVIPVKPSQVAEADNSANVIFWVSVGSIGLLVLLIMVQVRKEINRRREHEARLAESRQRQARLFKG